MNNYRLYAFSNFYLSSLQQGLQTAHLVSELFTKYKVNSTEYKILQDWAKKDKTIIILNGGNSQNISKIYYDIESIHQIRKFKEWQFPFAKFNEDMDSLCEALTVCGIILPEWIYKHSQYDNSDMPNIYDTKTEEYIYDKYEFIKQYQLVR